MSRTPSELHNERENRKTSDRVTRIQEEVTEVREDVADLKARLAIVEAEQLRTRENVHGIRAWINDKYFAHEVAVLQREITAKETGAESKIKVRLLWTLAGVLATAVLTLGVQWARESLRGPH